MDLTRVVDVVVVVALGAAATAAHCRAGEEPEFALSFGGCRAEVEGRGGDAFEATYDSVLTARNSPSASDGAQGWSLAMAAVGAIRIVDLTFDGTVSADASEDSAGLREAGFARIQVSDGMPLDAEGSCRDGSGVSGAVTAVVLSFTRPVTLPAEGAATIARIMVAGEFPPLAEIGEPASRVAGSLQFTRHCPGVGQPLVNSVTWRGGSVTPTLGRCDVDLVSRSPCGTDAEGVQLIFQDRSLAAESELAQVGQPLAGLLTERDSDAAAVVRGVAPAGDVGLVDVWAAISSDLPEARRGVGSWSLSVAASGDLDLVGATIAETAGEWNMDRPTGGRVCFERTELVDPELGGQGQGAVSAVISCFTGDGVLLLPRGTATVLHLELSGRAALGPADGSEPTPRVAEPVWRDGLRGSGQPVINAATVGGATTDFLCRQAARVELATLPDAAFRRCDANDDGAIDVADAISIVGELFLGDEPATCQDAADCDGDGRRYVTDAIFLVTYRFLGGAPPPAPFPGCGRPPPPPDGPVALGCRTSSACEF